jgi:hypothetical protein
MSHLVVCCVCVCVPLPSPPLTPTIILAVSFLIMQSTKYVALRLIGTVINVADRERERERERERRKIVYLVSTINNFV